jgi:hypothetical protein
MSTQRILVDAVDFQIACRRFTIRAMVTRDRQLGVVDEYVLRLLAILERMPIARLRAWFGFAESEMETVLLDLGERRSWIELDGDDVLLAPAGRELFRSVGPDGIPYIVEVSPLIADVWFDLVSRNMVPRSRAHNVDYLVKLREQPSARDLPEAFAREAFETNFRHYARRIRRLPDPDTVNLYSVSEVHGGGYAYQVFPAGLSFDPEKLTVRPSFPEVDDGGATFQKLTVAASDAWQVLNPPDPSNAAAAEFERMTGQAQLATLLQDPTSRDAWRTAMSIKKRDDFVPTIGAAYLEDNVSCLLDAIGNAGGIAGSVEIVWLRPSGSSWGRTLRVAETLHELREMLRNAGVHDVSNRLVMPRATHRSIRTNHRRLFDAGILPPHGHLPPNLEIIMVRGIAALVNVHLPVAGHSVPIGGVVADPKRLARMADRLTPAGEGDWETLWPMAEAVGRRTRRTGTDVASRKER